MPAGSPGSITSARRAGPCGAGWGSSVASTTRRCPTAIRTPPGPRCGRCVTGTGLISRSRGSRSPARPRSAKRSRRRLSPCTAWIAGAPRQPASAACRPVTGSPAEIMPGWLRLAGASAAARTRRSRPVPPVCRSTGCRAPIRPPRTGWAGHGARGRRSPGPAGQRRPPGCTGSAPAATPGWSTSAREISRSGSGRTRPKPAQPATARAPASPVTWRHPGSHCPACRWSADSSTKTISSPLTSWPQDTHRQRNSSDYKACCRLMRAGTAAGGPAPSFGRARCAGGAQYRHGAGCGVLSGVTDNCWYRLLADRPELLDEVNF